MKSELGWSWFGVAALADKQARAGLLLLLGGLVCLFGGAESLAGQAHPTAAAGCQRLTLKGDVAAGGSWRRPMGEGWAVALVPVAAGSKGYSGWDVVVDREPASGYPDAALLATPPWGSMSEREIATTFGLRAQDAFGWNRRSFRFLVDAAGFAEARQLFAVLGPALGGHGQPNPKALGRLMELASHGHAAELKIVDARLVEGVADPASYAKNWALQAARLPHKSVAAPDGKATALGRLEWMKFELELNLPTEWKLPAHSLVKLAACE